MSSMRRILSSRANGARSRGPATPQGKRRSANNAVRHGLLAKCVVMSGESHENFEFGMVEEMASSYWRLRRAWAIETRLLDDSANDQPSGDQVGRIAAAFGALADGPRLALLLRYQATLHRMYQRATRTLLLLRSDCETNPVPFPDTPPSPQPSEEGGAGASACLLS